jgi:hypothetical protein
VPPAIFAGRRVNQRATIESKNIAAGPKNTPSLVRA